MIRIANCKSASPIIATYVTEDTSLFPSKITILNIGTELLNPETVEGKMLLTVNLSIGLVDDRESARAVVECLMDDWHWDPTADETAMLKAAEIRLKSTDLIQTGLRQYLVWATYRGTSLEAEALAYIPASPRQIEIDLGVESRSC